jgi:capsular exopolysaccharide synthesis family protein
MSQIFDALHRSEAERSGTDLAELSAAADLLEVAERQVVQFATEGDRPTESKQQTENDRQTQKERVDPFSQFQPVRVLVSPQSKLVCITKEESLAAEKFRFLGVRLRHLQQKRPLKRLLVTSSMAEEGKSTIAANLACTLAKRQLQKTLLLEGDLRRPSLAQQFGLGKIPGLSELLQGEPAPAMNIYQLEGLGFWMLPAGSPPRNPLELMQSGKLSALMDQLAGWFDWIVIDSPPVLPLADTSVWMRLADAVLLVTRPGTTAKRQLQRALEAVEQPKLLGALVNGSREVTLGDYYHYYAGKTAVPKAAGQPTTNQM